MQDADPIWQAWRARLAPILQHLALGVTANAASGMATDTPAPDGYAALCHHIDTAWADGESVAALNALFKAIGMAPRKLGKADLARNGFAAQANLLQPGWDVSRWSVDQAARTGLILRAAAHLPNAEALAGLLDTLCQQGDVQEQIALYQAYALLPQHPALQARAREAVRNAMRPVFAALALRNPWARHGFDDDAWNQMVVKTFFLDLPLWPIQGLAERANLKLTAVLCDLAEERRAAGRLINPELWRMLALCPDQRALAALEQAAQDLAARDAVARAVAESSAPVWQGAWQAARKALAGAAIDRAELARLPDWPALSQWTE